ncbi:DUF6093 family protein [Arthrobacter sp. JSM 101049]|uniref:DUF6093 family protein n=1 Tax=Arthrobacter sp. JSM 101049 TaxID=929097 RepID=UPI003568505A
MFSPYDAADILEGQRDAIESMRDTCDVLRPTGTTFNPETGSDEVTGPQVYPVDGQTGWCRAKAGTTMDGNAEAGSHVFTIERQVLVFPIGTGLRPGDLVNLRTSVANPILAGTRYEITGAARGSYQTAERWNVKAVTS